MRRLTSACLPGAQTLVDRVVLAVHGKQFDIGLAGGGHHDFAGGDQNFLVRKRDLLSCFHGGVRGFEAHDADGRGDQGRGGGMRGHGEHACGAVLNFRQFCEACGAQAFGEIRGHGRGGNRNQFGMVRAEFAAPILRRCFRRPGPRRRTARASLRLRRGFGVPIDPVEPRMAICFKSNAPIHVRPIYSYAVRSARPASIARLQRH